MHMFFGTLTLFTWRHFLRGTYIMGMLSCHPHSAQAYASTE